MKIEMAAIAVHQFADCVTCHSWSPDHSMIALCPNNNEVHIFKLVEGNWERIHVLQKHDQIIAGIDWSKSSNRIVTVSHDRNSYVWNHEGSVWVPTLVILRLNRAALCVQWSPKGNKFAVGSGAKTVCICYYEQENNWWVSKLIRKRHDSSVTSVAWHPNNVLIATTSTDGKCRVFSTFIKGVDAGYVYKVSEALSFCKLHIFTETSALTSMMMIGSKPKKSGSGSSLDAKFGEQIVQLDLSMCWAFGVKWSPSGNSLAYVGHNSMIYFVDEIGPSPSAQSVVLRDLPLRDVVVIHNILFQVMFVSEKLVIGVGYDCNPMIFAADGTGLWSFVRFLDEKKAASSSARYGSQLTEAFGKFYGSSKQGTSNDKARAGVHDNCINCIVPLKKSGSTKLSSFSTSGLDGKVVVWDLKHQEDLVEYL
ncbi:ARP2/3 complex, 41kDa subunit (p41-arc) [Cynara cardunculus var. scolymus]|uniref:Arp2/3 complex 41 kDa subunit n=1 Tax=Cynara cardunculus var. scolymus TaxID=59895 RepID=A0A103XTZ4_CYNCS|nr:ARP2/3 complex, 41kDa subunit (p41-arc) [Cynara cardunculus var. scolymus]